VRIARERYPGEVVRFVFIDDDEPRAKVVMAPADSPDRSKDHRVEFDLRTAEVVADTPPGGAHRFRRRQRRWAGCCVCTPISWPASR
jgi:uncharacterized iron-regulated membrane protein